MTALDHDGLLPKKQARPEWIWNRSDTHVILGVPEAPEAFTTVVEPGNSFSPGFRSFAVSTWISVGGRLVAPERMPADQLTWRYEEGSLPVLVSSWAAGPLRVRSELFTDGDGDRRDIRTFLAVTVENASGEPVTATLHLAVRSFGPAGAPIRELEFADRDVVINGAVLFTLEQAPDAAGAVSDEHDGLDIGTLLERGDAPSSASAADLDGWASGAASYDLSLAPGAHRTVRGTAFVNAGHDHLTWLRRERGLPFEAPDRQGFLDGWRERLPIRLDLPDARFAEAFRAQLAYLSMASVGIEPRISPISYPLWWLRDGAYVITALGKGGVTDWVDRAVRSVARRGPFGGFGSEGDGAGELIWLISEQYLLTRDLGFLREHWVDIERNARLIARMRRTTEPIWGHTEIRTPEMMFGPSADLMCAPAEDGLIRGRMDGHFPRFWVNGWALFGLRRAALCAEALGLDPSEWLDEAAEQQAAIEAKIAAHFGENDRDVSGSIWPTGWASPDDPRIRAGFDRFWNEVRFPGGVHVPEPEWTYFEAGQAHNLVMLGERERAWVSIEMFLSRHAAQGLYTYHEGIGDENSSLQWQRSRGWDDIPHVTPHGWTAAEVLLLLRDSLVRETADGRLVIGSGVPAEWLEHDFSAEHLPTHFGEVSFSYRAADRTLEVRTERAPAAIVADLPSAVTLVDVTSAAAVR